MLIIIYILLHTDEVVYSTLPLVYNEMKYILCWGEMVIDRLKRTNIYKFFAKLGYLVGLGFSKLNDL